MAIILQEYERLKFLGKGAFAQIYKVRHKDLGYIRAIKVLTEEVNEGEDDKVYKTFLKECSLLLRIGNGGHPNIIRIYQPRKIDGKALVEMDYIDGVTLESYISENQFLPIDEVYRFIKEIGSALAYCHVDCYRYMMRPEEKDEDPKDLIRKYGVAHNDIHSNNIMRKDLDGSYVLLDFGLAIQDDKAVKSSSRGDGAAEYIPPEKWSGDQILNEKAVDIYGFGILIYQMLTGQVPFVLDPNEYKKDSLKTLNMIRHRHESERPADILPLRKAAYERVTGKTDYERDYPQWLDELVFKCLEKNPEDRFHDAKELQEFFLGHLEEDSSFRDGTIEALKKSNRALSKRIQELEADANKGEDAEKLKAELDDAIKSRDSYSHAFVKREKDNKRRIARLSAVSIILFLCLICAGGILFYLIEYRLPDYNNYNNDMDESPYLEALKEENKELREENDGLRGENYDLRKDTAKLNIQIYSLMSNQLEDY